MCLAPPSVIIISQKTRLSRYKNMKKSKSPTILKWKWYNWGEGAERMDSKKLRKGILFLEFAPLKNSRSFTLLELIIVLVIISVLASLGFVAYEGAVIKARMAELYHTVAAIDKAETGYFYEYGEYAANDDGIPGGDLPYSTTQATIDNFANILGVGVPGMNSIFVYGVYYDPAKIYVRVRNNPDTPVDEFSWGILCYKTIEGASKGTWTKVPAHPWAKYLSVN